MKFLGFPRVFTVDEVAELLRTTPEVVVGEIDSEKLSGFKVGGEWRVNAFALAMFMGNFGHRRRRGRHARAGRKCGTKAAGQASFTWQTTAPFTYQWPQRTDGPEAAEEYAEAFESSPHPGSRFRQVKLVIGFTTRNSAGMENRRRAVVFLVRKSRRHQSAPQLYPLVEFAGANDYETTRRMASVIKLPDRTHLKAGEPIPPAYEHAQMAVYSDVVSGPYAASGMAVVVQDTDLDAMARHALIRLRWSFRRRMSRRDVEA